MGTDSSIELKDKAISLKAEVQRSPRAESVRDLLGSSEGLALAI